MAIQKVVNNPLGSYPVSVDRTSMGEERQAVGIDIGDVVADVWTPSRVSASNPLPVTVTGGAGTTDVNLIEVGGVATSLGQKAEAASIPVVLATEQDTAKDGTETAQGQFTGVGVFKAAPFEGNPAWGPWPASVEGVPYAGVWGYEPTSQQSAPIYARSGSGTITNGSTEVRLLTNGFVSGPGSGLDAGSVRAARVLDVDPISTDPALAVRNIPSGTQAVSAASLPLPTGAATSALQTQPGVDIGDVTVNNAAGASAVNIQDGGNSITVDGTVTASLAATVSTTGNITASAQTIPVVLGEQKFVTLDISGTYGSVALAFEISLDGTNYRAIAMSRIDANTVETVTGTISSTTRTWEAHCGAATHFRVRSTAWTSGTMAVRINNSASDAEPVPTTQTHAVTMTSTTITSEVPGTGATNLGKARDAAVGATDTGVAALFQRRDAPVVNAGVSANLDYVNPIVSNFGTLWTTLFDTKGNNSPDFLATPPLVSTIGMSTRAVGVYSAPSTATSRTSTTQIPHGYYYYSSRTTTTGSTTTAIVVTADASTQCRRGDIIRVATGTHAQGIYEWGVVASVATVTITLDLQTPLSLAITNGLTIEIWKPGFLSVNSANALVTSTNITGGTVNTTPVSGNKTFFESGSVAFGSINSSITSMYTTTNQGYMCEIANTTNVELGYSLDGGTSEHFIPADSTAQWNLMDLGGYMESGTDVQAYYPGPAAPTRGRISFMLAYY